MSGSAVASARLPDDIKPPDGLGNDDQVSPESSVDPSTSNGFNMSSLNGDNPAPSTFNDRNECSTITNDQTQLNPLYDLSQQIESGQLEPVHVVKVAKDGTKVDWIQGSPPTVGGTIGTRIGGLIRKSSPTTTTTTTKQHHLTSSSDGMTTGEQSSQTHRARNQNVQHDTVDNSQSQTDATGRQRRKLQRRMRPRNGNEQDNADAGLTSSSTSSSDDESSCDEKDGNSNRLVLVGSGTDNYRPEEDQVNGLDDFRDHEFESSTRDELRMKAVGWRQKLKGKARDMSDSINHGHQHTERESLGSQVTTDPNVTAALARQPSTTSQSLTSDTASTSADARRRDSLVRNDSATAGTDGTSLATPTTLDTNGSFTSAATAPSIRFNSSSNHDTTTSVLSSSPQSSAYMSLTDRPFRSESPESFRYLARTSTPPPAGVIIDSDSASTTTMSVDTGRDRTPVLNAPGQYVTNSRAPPPSVPGSPPRLVPVTSLNKPLHPHASNSSLRPPSSSTQSRIGGTSPRRSVTALGPTTSRSSVSSGSRLGPPVTTPHQQPQRSLSFQYTTPNSPGGTTSNSFFSTNETSYFSNQHHSSNHLYQNQQQQQQHSNFVPPNQSIQQHNFNDVESSIAAQAEMIRKQRQEKRLEKEKEQAGVVHNTMSGSSGLVGQSTLTTTGGSAVAASSGGGAPMMRRRTTRAGSGDMREPGAGVLVGNLIGQDHANYVLMYNMLTGIRIGVSRCEAKPKREITDADYTARHKFSFDIVGNELTPSVKYDFKFKDYAPWVFRELREYFYLDPSDYLVSLTAKYILSELGSPGKSGSFFYFSRDYRFIIKTIRHSEHKFLRSILKQYHQHVKNNPHTLLSRFYGLHRVKLPRGRKIHFVIMNNLFPPHRDIHETYDLKGSAIGRMYPEDKAKDNPRAILKDLNFIERDRFFKLGPTKKALFEEQLRRDVELMQKLGIMDYSLLTGIHNVSRGNVDKLRDNMLTVFQPETVKIRRRGTLLQTDADKLALRKAVERSDPKALGDSNQLPDRDLSERRLFLFYQDEGGMKATGQDNVELDMIYYLGIIDILTPYTLVKKLEHFFKGFKHDKHMISAVAPKEYGERFLSFIYSRISGNDPTKGPKMYEHDHHHQGGRGPKSTPAEEVMNGHKTKQD
ncbi:Phosphatidylinositol-4-phosphate 5-kinase [Microbotryomycetes sp. JL221]|nr:Phosphatidylinositol-4-phosphate 5-kinase [Microbotryomycetes sp. JL221]